MSHRRRATIWRVVTGADAAAVDAVIGAWLAAQAAPRDAAARGPDPDSGRAQRATQAMLSMNKIEIAELLRAADQIPA